MTSSDEEFLTYHTMNDQAPKFHDNIFVFIIIILNLSLSITHWHIPLHVLGLGNRLAYTITCSRTRECSRILFMLES